MKKLIALALSFVFVFALVGCSGVTTGESLLLREGNVKRISVSSLPEGYDYSFSGKDTETIVDYLSNLNLIEQFEENPNEYTGITWVISLEYDDGDALQIYHFGNMFIRVKGGSWYKMTYEEASRLHPLLKELNSSTNTDGPIQLHPLYEKYPEYFNLDTTKGLEVYVWQMSGNLYHCGVLTGTNRMKTEEEIQGLMGNGATIEEMKDILSAYGIEKSSVVIYPVHNPVSSYWYEIDDEYRAKIEAMFWGE